MRKILMILVAFSFQLILAQTIAYTSFEEPSTGSIYTDTGDPATDHALVNNPGEADVNFTSTGGELGFSSYYYNTRNDVGLTDGDYVGVTNYTSHVGSYPDGTNGFEMSDTDGKMRVTFDAVSLSGTSNPNFSMQYYVNETGWESDDLIRIWLVVDGGTEIDLLNTSGSDIDDLGIEGSWLTLSTDLSGYTTATLKVELDCNSASEELYIDDIQFVEGPLDTKVKFSKEGDTVNEGDGTYSLVVSIENPDENNATSADVVLISGDAADINNYTTQTVTFPANSSDSQIVVITITDDSEVEGNEVLTFELQNITGGNNASAGNPSQFNLTIEDNDFAQTPDIVINEIMQNPAAVNDSKGEWFELYNASDSDVDIDGWIIKDDGTDSHTINNGGPLIISAGGYLVLGINDTVSVNGGVHVDYVYSSFTLGNSSDEVVLVYSDGVSEVDRVNYDNGATFPDPSGKSMELINPGYDNNDGTNWAEATAVYGDGDMGTPGAQNSTFVSAIQEPKNKIVTGYKLFVNFPNPFNPSTTLRFNASRKEKVFEIDIFDVLGKKIRTLYSGPVEAGHHELVWDGRNDLGRQMPSGIYFARLKTKGFSQTIKMLMAK